MCIRRFSFSSVLVQEGGCPFVFILGDLEEAGYFYHDLTQILGTERVLFFPSSFRRSIKYGQKMRPMRFCVQKYLAACKRGRGIMYRYVPGCIGGKSGVAQGIE